MRNAGRGLWAVLKNNTKRRPAWQEIVDFS
jgi:hypothetical protein